MQWRAEHTISTICISLSSASSSPTPTIFISSFPTSLNLSFGLPLYPLSYFTILLPIYSLFILYTCQPQSRINFSKTSITNFSYPFLPSTKIDLNIHIFNQCTVVYKWINVFITLQCVGRVQRHNTTPCKRVISRCERINNNIATCSVEGNWPTGSLPVSYSRPYLDVDWT